MLPIGQRPDAVEPFGDIREGSGIDAELVAEEQIAAERQVGDRRSTADDEILGREMAVEHAIGAIDPCPQELGHRRLSRLHVGQHEAQRRRVAGEFMIVEQDPPQNLAPLILALRPELSTPLGEVVEDHPGLRQPHRPMQQHRCLGHLVHLAAVFFRSGLAIEVIHMDLFPIHPRKLQHQRCLVAIPGLAETIKPVLGHASLPRVAHRTSNTLVRAPLTTS